MVCGHWYSQFIFQTCNDVTCVGDLPQPPAELTGGEILQHSPQESFIKRPTQSTPLTGEVHAAQDEPDRGAGHEVDEVLPDVDEDVVDVEDAGVDGGGVDTSEGQFLLWLVLAEISRKRSVDSFLLVFTENIQVVTQTECRCLELVSGSPD